MSEPTPHYPGQWIEATKAKQIDSVLANMMAANKTALVWAGVKTEGSPVHVLTQSGQRHEIPHAPVNTFSERLHALVGTDSDSGQGANADLNPAEVYARRRATAEAARNEPEQTSDESNATAKADDPLDSESIYERRRAGIRPPAGT